MSAPVDFYFDFSSPYAAIAAHKLLNGALPAGTAVHWTPILVGAVFKHLGREMPSSVRMHYMMRDSERCAAECGFTLRWPSRFPMNSLNPSRAFYSVCQYDPAGAIRLAVGLFQAYWSADKDISDVAVIAAVASDCRLDPDTVVAGIADQSAKDSLRKATDTAIERGVFGVPFFFLADDPYWGADRLEHIASALDSN